MSSNSGLRSVPLLSLLVFCPLAGCTAADPPMAGGYHAVALSPDIQAAAQMAVSAQAKKENHAITLVKVRRVEAQVVAGMNYRLTLEVAAPGTSGKALAVVYRGLDDTLELTSWEWIK